jgi:hypothetical protein
MLAALLGTPPESLPTPEAEKRLAQALLNVQAHYPIPSVSPGRMAVAALLWAAWGCYKPMVLSATKGAPATPAPAHASAPAPHAAPVQVPEVQDWFTGASGSA